MVRSNRNAQQLAASVHDTLRGLDPGLPLTIMTWQKELDSALLRSPHGNRLIRNSGRINRGDAGGCWVSSAWPFTQWRRHKGGIRVALGARSIEVLQAALGKTCRILVTGAVAGLLGMAATRVLSYIVYQATPRDPAVLAGVLVTMLGVGLLAAFGPARRALVIDPAILS